MTFGKNVNKVSDIRNISGVRIQMWKIIHIYGDRAIFLLLCDHQDTESEACEIEMSISTNIHP